MTNTDRLRARLQTVWKPADFAPFFKKFSKRSPHKIKKGTILFNQGDPLERLYFIQQGFIKLYQISEEGRETTIYLYGPGYVLGVRALTSKDTSAKHNAETITDTIVLTMSHREYFDAIIANPEYLLDLTHIFIDRLNYTERKLEGFIITDTTARVANFLADCIKRFCHNGKKNEPIVLPFELTHQRIAEFVGSFRETATVAIQRLEKEGILTVDRGKVTILNVKKLTDYAQFHKRS